MGILQVETKRLHCEIVCFLLSLLLLSLRKSHGIGRQDYIP